MANKLVSGIESLIKDLMGSLHNNDGGFSARKLTALATMAMVANLDVSFQEYAVAKGDYSLLPEIMGMHLLFILILLGIITMEQVIKFKETKKNEPGA